LAPKIVCTRIKEDKLKKKMMIMIGILTVSLNLSYT